MTLYKLLIIGILTDLLNECETIADALRYDDEKALALAKNIANAFIQTLWRLMVDTNANLLMGMNNIPIDKQYSLRLLKKRITVDDVILALRGMDDCVVQSKARQALTDSATEEEIAATYTLSAFNHRTDREIIKLFRSVEPVFIMLDISFSDEDVLMAYNRYLIKTR